MSRHTVRGYNRAPQTISLDSIQTSGSWDFSRDERSANEKRSHARSERFRTGRLAKGDIGNLLASWAKANPDRPPVSLARVSILEDAECP